MYIKKHRVALIVVGIFMGMILSDYYLFETAFFYYTLEYFFTHPLMWMFITLFVIGIYVLAYRGFMDSVYQLLVCITKTKFTYLSGIQHLVSVLLNRDMPTGLLNREGFLEAIALEKARVRRNGGTFSVVSLTFPEIENIVKNDPILADRMMKGALRRLLKHVRRPDQIGRVGPAEVAIIAVNTDEPIRIHRMCFRLDSALVFPVKVKNINLRFTPSFAAARFSIDSEDPAKLLEFASAAHDEKLAKCVGFVSLYCAPRRRKAKDDTSNFDHTGEIGIA